MEIRNKINGGKVTVSPEYAERLVATGEYEKVSARKKSSRSSKNEESKEG